MVYDLTWFQQTDYEIRTETGIEGLRALYNVSDVIVIVDVLSFSSCVGWAVHRGAEVLPFPWKDGRAEQFALEQGARLAGERGTSLSLSPGTMFGVQPRERIVLPSPNGARLSFEFTGKPTFTASFCNARAVARSAMACGYRIAVIAAGERWPNDTLRPCLEDVLGVGAVISELHGRRSPEAAAAVAQFAAVATNLPDTLRCCSSGKELIARGFADDVEIAAQWNTVGEAPMLSKGSYQRYSGLA